jgi:phospholipid/cholesterol/gamma-HCH transport system ATP-binding protein
MIEVRNISKSFAEKQVLQNISVTFETGKTNLIIGQSGSGKTVLLKSIIGLHEVDEGDIIYGSDIFFNNLSFIEKKRLRMEIGMLFQSGALFDSSTVEENIMYPMDMFTDMSSSEKRDRANFCLERVNLKNVNHLYPSEISGGMQKRVAIARAIALNPKYLFCDEPNSGLDPQTSIIIDNLIKEITEEYNITTIINTHDMNSVMEIGEKIVFIYKGKKEWEGCNKEILFNDNEHLNDFVFASNMAKELKKILLKEHRD